MPTGQVSTGRDLSGDQCGRVSSYFVDITQTKQGSCAANTRGLHVTKTRICASFYLIRDRSAKFA